MSHNMLFSEGIGVLAVVDPASKSANTYTTGWVDLSIWGKCAALLVVGAIAGSGTVAAKLEQSGPTSGTGTKDVTGKAITGLTQTPTDNSNSQLWINCNASDLDVVNGFRYVRLSFTTATAASIMTGLILAADCKYGPASDHDSATVTQYVN